MVERHSRAALQQKLRYQQAIN